MEGGEGCGENGNVVDEQYSREKRRQEGIRSLPVPAFHLAIHTAAMVMAPSMPSVACGSFQ